MSIKKEVDTSYERDPRSSFWNNRDNDDSQKLDAYVATHTGIPDLSVVVPVYKEEANIRPFLQRLEAVVSNMEGTYEVIFCLDPSPDGTEEVVLQEINRNPNIRLLVFSRRF